MRSAQFGVYQSVVSHLEKQYGRTDPNDYWLGCINPHVVAAGWAGGIGRGLVEGPFEMIKVRKQLVSGWKFGDAFQGGGTTMVRNSFLFSAFVIYMDVFKQQIEQKGNWIVTPFVKAGICANVAWLTIWPLDVVKTRRQSGKYDGKSIFWILRDAFRSNQMYRGLSVGMLRSFIANGAGMEVDTLVENELEKRFQENGRIGRT